MADYWNKEILILGCGNVLFGDDGFGPEVVEYFQKNYEIPEQTYIMNAGLSVREILFTLVLSEKKPRRIIILDAVDMGKTPGEIFDLDVSELPEKKTDDFSMHQLPTSNLLRELKFMCEVDVRIIAVQIQNVPEEVSPGISKIVRDSFDAVCKRILAEIC